uniref:NR LBD domain-containing protein n=1 Tax=Rhabditophanes sp. KR3021 TaxID=114890 RepID=A0AC35U2F3_9BILA
MVWKQTNNSNSDGSTDESSIKRSLSDNEHEENVSFSVPDKNEVDLRKFSADSSSYKQNFTPSSALIKDNQIAFDTSELLGHVRSILHGARLKIPGESNYNMSSLQTFCYGIQQLLDSVNYKPASEIEICEALEFKSYIAFHNKICIKLSEALMYSSQFCDLSKHDKTVLYNHLSPFFLQIERVYSSFLVFGIDSRTLILFDDCQAFDENFAIFSDSELPEYSKKKLFNLYKNCNDFLLNQLYLPLKSLNLDSTEFSFFIAIFLFSVEDLVDISEEGKQACSRIVKVLNDDMHNYYVFSKNKIDYAHRITEIVRLISKTSCYVSKKADMVSVTQLMGVFDISTIYLNKLKEDNPLLNYLKS